MADSDLDFAPAPAPVVPAPPVAFVIEGKRKEPMNVRLVGVDYRVLPPKALVALNMGRRLSAAGDDLDQTMVEMSNWVNSIFGRKQGPLIMERLQDPDDALDLDNVTALVRQLIEKSTGNPTM